MTYNYKTSIDKRIINVLLSLIFIVFLTYFIINKGFSPWRYSVIITIIGIYVLSKKSSLKPNVNLFLFCCLGAWVIVKSGVWHSGRFLCWLLVFLLAIFEDDVVDHQGQQVESLNPAPAFLGSFQ